MRIAHSLGRNLQSKLVGNLTLSSKSSTATSLHAIATSRNYTVLSNPAQVNNSNDGNNSSNINSGISSSRKYYTTYSQLPSGMYFYRTSHKCIIVISTLTHDAISKHRAPNGIRNVSKVCRRRIGTQCG